MTRTVPAHVVEVVSKEFALGWIELRSMWKKNVMEIDEKEIAEARNLIEKANLGVTDIASPIFKVDWPGAALSELAERRDTFHGESSRPLHILN
jgi:hypothetical protein